ncbi:hypothetical protein LCGC14_2862070, partial [marine sediment metagenome]
MLRYLAPGAKVAQTVRVDVGQAERMLQDQPLERLTITVQGMLDPLQQGKDLFSTVPELKIAPAVVVRAPLFDVSGGELAARTALGMIVRDLQGPSLPVRLRAARQTASLLAHVRRVERGQAKAVLAGVLTEGILLSMTRAFLQADSPVLRAEMIGALNGLVLDARIIALTGPCVEDRSPLVRLRLIELLAANRTRG